MKTRTNSRKIRIGTAAVVLFLLAHPTWAVMMSMTEFTLDFTKPAELSKKATWGAEAKDVSLSEEGLNLKAQENTSADVWIQVTEPIAVGWSWRTVSSVHINAEVAPPGEFIINGSSTIYPGGSLYARYSADALHWSSWQYIKMDPPKDVNKPEQKYSGALAVPARQQQKYSQLLRQYSKLDVPWSSDEEAAVEWIVKNEPNFFENPAPFIGYIQFLFEISLKGGQNIKTIKFDIDYAAGGKHATPKDPNVYNERMKSNSPWRYKTPSISQTKTNGRAAVIKSAIDAYYLNCGVYPKSLDDLLTCPTGLERSWAGPYIKESGLYDSQGRKYIYTPDGKVAEDSDTK
jgi:hypothetical protein